MLPFPKMPRAWLLLAALVLGGCAGGGLPPAQAAQVNGTVIGVDRLAGEVEAARATLAGQQQAPDGQELTRATLEQLIQTEILLGGARAEGVTVSQQEVDLRVNVLRGQAGAVGTTLEEALASRGLTVARLRDQLRVQIAADQVAAKLVPGPDDATLQQRRQDALLDWYRELALEADVRVNPRFGRWDPGQVRLADRATAPRPPATSAPAGQP